MWSLVCICYLFFPDCNDLFPYHLWLSEWLNTLQWSAHRKVTNLQNDGRYCPRWRSFDDNSEPSNSSDSAAINDYTDSTSGSDSDDNDSEDDISYYFASDDAEDETLAKEVFIWQQLTQ